MAAQRPSRGWMPVYERFCTLAVRRMARRPFPGVLMRRSAASSGAPPGTRIGTLAQREGATHIGREESVDGAPVTRMETVTGEHNLAPPGDPQE